MMDPTDWQGRAACRNEDPELFFPPSAAGPALTQAARAKAVCAQCPVRTPCLHLALEHGLDHGVFGGLTDLERRALVLRAARDEPFLARRRKAPVAQHLRCGRSVRGSKGGRPQ